jgi:hypothetical protein
VHRLAEIGAILMAAAAGFLVLRPLRMGFSFELYGKNKNLSFNLITFWILFISGGVLMVWQLAGMIGHV